MDLYQGISRDMLKRILVVLDGSTAGSVAKRYAIKLAKQLGAELTGVGIIDTPWITAAQPEPLGGAAFKIHRDQEIIKQNHKKIMDMLARFKILCEEGGIKYSVAELEGFPATEIETLAEKHDLIIIGRTTDLHFDLDVDTDLTVRHIIRDNPRPIVVVTSDYEVDKSVLIAYDGSLQAARALHMYLLLGIGRGQKVRILSIAKKHKDAEVVALRAQEMCNLHGVDAEIEAIASRAAPEDVIKKKAKELGVTMVVLGAFGKSGIREFLFGTTTEHLLKDSEVSLFIHH
jgi:nucleotide-binding universal stress UspA family protein